MPSKPKNKTVKKKKLSAVEKIQRKQELDHAKLIRGIFTGSGFQRCANAANKNFQFSSVNTDFDDVFVYENLVILLEYTTSSRANVGDHLKGKSEKYNIILDNKDDFIDFLMTKSSDFSSALENYDPEQATI